MTVCSLLFAAAVLFVVAHQSPVRADGRALSGERSTDGAEAGRAGRRPPGRPVAGGQRHQIQTAPRVEHLRTGPQS